MNLDAEAAVSSLLELLRTDVCIERLIPAALEPRDESSSFESDLGNALDRVLVRCVQGSPAPLSVLVARLQSRLADIGGQVDALLSDSPEPAHSDKLLAAKKRLSVVAGHVDLSYLAKRQAYGLDAMCNKQEDADPVAARVWEVLDVNIKLYYDNK